jgi:hypothetical protein
MWILILSADARILGSGLQVCCERGRWSLRVRGNVPQCGLPGSLLLLLERGDFSRGHRVRIAAQLREPAPDIRIADHLARSALTVLMIESSDGSATGAAWKNNRRLLMKDTGKG